MALSPEQRKFWLEGVIPRRMQDLAFCEVVCYVANEQRGEQSGTFILGSQGISASDGRTFVNPVFLSGVVLCRGMLAFLGIKIQSRSNPPALTGRLGRHDPDDIVCEDFGVAAIPLAEFRKLTQFNIADGEAAIIEVLRLANKDAAHLTAGIDGLWDIRRLAYTCNLTNRILNGYFYDCLQLPPIILPKFMPQST